MNRKLRRILSYFGMTVLYMLLGAAVLFIAGKPVAEYAIAQGKMAIMEGAPELDEYTSDLTHLELNIKEEEAFDLSEIKVPEPESKYADIECERIGLSAPVYYGDSDTVFMNGVGQYPESGLPGEGRPILIGGHDSTYFASLEQAQPGDIISITVNWGTFEYKVSSVKTANAEDNTAYDLVQEKEQLILYTCYPFGQLVGNRSGRFYVYCERIQDTDPVEE